MKKLYFRQRPSVADKVFGQDVFWVDVDALRHLLETGVVVTLDAVKEEDVDDGEA